MSRLLGSRAIPAFDRVLMVESGSRYLVEDLLDGIYEVHPQMRLDLLTCYAGAPNNFRADRGSVFRISDHPARKALLQHLRGQNYTVLGVVCSGEPIMTKWKWAAMAYVPAKTFILNENGDYFWLDYSNWKVVRHFILFRAGLAGAGAVRTLARLVTFPLSLAYLLAFAAIVHFRRNRRLHT